MIKNRKKNKTKKPHFDKGYIRYRGNTAGPFTNLDIINQSLPLVKLDARGFP